MTSTNATAATAELTKPGGTLDLGHDKARLLIRTMRLLARGGPITRVEALDATVELGIDRTWAGAQLDAWAERDQDGRIIGLGITHNPTPHQMTIDGHRMWAWCGMDTLIFAHILNTSIAVQAHAPVSGDVVRLHASPSGVTDIHPTDAVVTERVPRRDQVNFETQAGIWGTLCHHNHFFPGRADAQEWVAERDDIVILSIADRHAVAREIAGALLRYEPENDQ